MTPGPFPCPTDTQIALRIQGALSEAAAHAFDEHIDACRDCYALIRELAAAEDDSGHEAPPSPSAEHALGRYVLRRPLGAGGMGAVHAAYDPELEREVAIKIVAVGKHRRDLQARLLREAKALARLRHPNVVTVYDVGQHGPDVYLVMELVAGQTLTQWRSTPRGVSEILAVFGQVARGVAAAHAQGLVHRDIKPDNILIDAEGRALLADFGLVAGDEAPVDDGGALEESAEIMPVGELVLTRPGSLVGSPRYIAPEIFSGQRGNARSDQFSFCVALYETLYDVAPFAGDTLDTLSAHVRAGQLRVPPVGARVPRRVRAALTRGLQADPEQRFADMDTLAQRLLPSRRRWVAGLTVGVPAAALLGWWVGTPEPCPRQASIDALADAWGPTVGAAVSAGLQRGAPGYGGQEARRVVPAIDAYAQGWIEARHTLCQAGRVRSPQSPELLDRRAACLQRARQDLVAATGLLTTADAEVVARAYRLVEGLPDLARCADLTALQQDVAPPPADAAAAVDEVRAGLAQVEGLIAVGKHKQAQAAVEPLTGAAAQTGYAPVVNEAQAKLGHVRRMAGDYESGATLTREALTHALAAGQLELASRCARELVFVVGASLHRPAEGFAFVPVAEGLAQRLGRDDLSARLQTIVASVHAQAGDFQAAVRAYNDAIDTHLRGTVQDERGLINARAGLASVLSVTGAYEAAIPELSAVTAYRVAHLAADHPAIAEARMDMAMVMMGRGDYQGAQGLVEQALRAQQRSLGPEHPEVAATRGRLAEIFRAQRRPQAAVVELRAAVDIAAASLGPAAVTTSATRTALAGAIMDAGGDPAEAEAQARQALADAETALGPEHPVVAEARMTLAGVLERRGREPEALELDRRALADLARVLPEGHNTLTALRATIGRLLLARGDVAEARALLQVACPAFGGGNAPPVNEALCNQALAQAMWATPGDRPAAHAMAQQAREALREAGYAAEVEQLDDWLRAHAL